MSVEVILRNIFSFVEILEVARSKAVAIWTTNSLENALKWAKYCEKIYAQSREKAYITDLDEQIQKLNLRLWKLGGLHINLDLLKESQYHLICALLQNPFLSSQLYGVVLKTCLDAEEDKLFEICSNVSWPKVTANALSKIQSSCIHGTAAPSDSLSQERRPKDAVSANDLETSACLLHGNLTRILTTIPPSERRDRFLESRLQDVLAERYGFETVLRCLQVDSKNQRRSDDNNLTPIMLNHLEGILNEDRECQFLRQAPLTLLAGVAARNFAFFTCYLSHLIRITKRVLLHVHPRDPRPCWGSVRSHGWCYNEVLTHMKSLRSEHERVTRAVDSTLEQIAQREGGILWRTLVADLHQ